MNDSCIFCKIIQNEIPAATIYEDENFKVILDAFPSSPGHTLILPKKHAGDIFELDPETGSKLFALAVQIAQGLKKTLSFDGLNLLQNNGAAAGQTVNHFHLHLIPRYENDKVQMKWQTCETKPEENMALAERIRKNITI